MFSHVDAEVHELNFDMFRFLPFLHYSHSDHSRYSLIEFSSLAKRQGSMVGRSPIACMWSERLRRLYTLSACNQWFSLHQPVTSRNAGRLMFRKTTNLWQAAALTTDLLKANLPQQWFDKIPRRWLEKPTRPHVGAYSRPQNKNRELL